MPSNLVVDVSIANYSFSALLKIYYPIGSIFLLFSSLELSVYVSLHNVTPATNVTVG